MGSSMKNLKIAYLSLVIAGCWPGSIFALQVFNRSSLEKKVAVSGTKGKSLATITAPSGKKTKLSINQALPELPLSIGWGQLITVQKDPQQTVIEPHSAATGWIATGKDKDGNLTLVRLVPPTATESIPKNATFTYKKIGDQIVRVDTFPATMQDEFTHKQTFQEPSYARTVQPNSYIIISQNMPNAVSVQMFHPMVVKAAVIGKKK